MAKLTPIELVGVDAKLVGKLGEYKTQRQRKAERKLGLVKLRKEKRLTPAELIGADKKILGKFGRTRKKKKKLKKKTMRVKSLKKQRRKWRM